MATSVLAEALSKGEKAFSSSKLTAVKGGLFLALCVLMRQCLGVASLIEWLRRRCKPLLSVFIISPNKLCLCDTYMLSELQAARPSVMAQCGTSGSVDALYAFDLQQRRF